MHPHARRKAAAEFGIEAEAPDRHHVDCIMGVGFGGLQQIGTDRHRRGRADQAERGHFCGMTRGRLERDQRAHGMADQVRLGRAGRIQQRRSPVRHLGDGLSAGPVERPWPGRSAPARQSHDGRTSACAAPRSNDRIRRHGSARLRQGFVEFAAAGRDESSAPLTVSFMVQTFCETRSAYPRSSMMSCAASMPTESRTSSSPMPAALSARHPSADAWWWPDGSPASWRRRHWRDG